MNRIFDFLGRGSSPIIKGKIAGKRLLGLTLDDKKAIYQLRPSHSLLLSAAGGG